MAVLQQLANNLFKIRDNGTIVLLGGIVNNTTSVTDATYTTLATDHYLLCNRAGVITVTLETDTVEAGRRVHIADISGDASTNNITIDTESSETIDGATSQIISTDYGTLTLVSDGTNWFIE